MYADLDTLAKRVKFFREKKNFTHEKLASLVLVKDEETGEMRPINPSVIGNLERRNSKTNKYTSGIAKALGVNVEWLMSGEGEPIINAQAPSINTPTVEETFSEYVIIGGKTDYPLVLIDYLDIKASCGGGYVNDEHPDKKGQIAFTVEFLREQGLPIDGDGLVLMHACGDSMGYTIPHGTLMLVNKKENQFENMASKQIYSFNADGETICKRAFKNLDGSITLVSDNSDKTRYPDQLITKEKYTHFAIFGRVRYTFNQF